MKIHFIAYYDDSFNNKFLMESNRTMNNAIKYFDTVTIYNRKDLIKEKFYDENKKILDQEKYAGWCLWKPYFIFKKLNEIEKDDIVFYMDVGDVLRDDIRNFLIETIEKNNGYFLVQNSHSNKKWTTKDCFVFMGCDESKYWDANQLEAGTIGFKKNDNVLIFVEEWLNFCKNENILTKNNINENYSEYCGDNRADQSVLTNLKIKYDIPTISIRNVSYFIRYNVEC